MPRDRRGARARPPKAFLLWISLTRVVSSTVNIRAPGVLGRLQTEMRAGQIRDEMWRLYLSRVLQANDPRLEAAPFNNANVQYIVHRHRIRVSQSFQNAIEHCRCLLYTSPSPRDGLLSRMPSSA